MRRLYRRFAALPLLSVCACGTNQSGLLESDVLGDLHQELAPRGPFDDALTAACGPGGLTEAGASVLQRPPYLQRMTARSAAILWVTDAADASDVLVTQPDGTVVHTAVSQVDEGATPAVGDQYVAELEGLAPGQIYCYQIAGESQVWLNPTGFRTAPPPGAPIAFSALGDIGIAGGDQLAVADQLASAQADFVLVVGDVGYESGTLASYENYFFAIYDVMLRSVPFFPALGNHDYGTGDAGPYREVFSLPGNGDGPGNERWYSFDWGDLHVAVLDTERDLDVQVPWLDGDLAATEAAFKVVVAHQPPYSSGYHGSNLAVRDRFAAVFERRGVQLVLSGDDHDYERSKPINGVTYVVTGGGGRGTRPVGASSFTELSSQVAHFVNVRIESGAMVLHAIDGTGQEFDAPRLE